MVVTAATTVLFAIGLNVGLFDRFGKVHGFQIQPEYPVQPFTSPFVRSSGTFGRSRPLIVGCPHSTTTVASRSSHFASYSSKSRSESSSRSSRSSSTRLYVFDFFRKRAEEGVEQLSNLATSAAEGRLGQGLTEAAAYTEETNRKFSEGLAKSRNRLLYDLDALLSSSDKGDFFEDLEDLLLQADLGYGTVDGVLEELRSLRDESTEFFTRDDLRSVLRGRLLEALAVSSSTDRALRFSDDPTTVPTVLFVMGANGMGKTTTIGKLAYRLAFEADQRVLLAACDTFRAGAVDQLRTWADRVEAVLDEAKKEEEEAALEADPSSSTVTTTSTTTTTSTSSRRGSVECFGPTVEGDSSGDRSRQATSPSTVLYGAIEKCVSEQFDILIVDTSGRLSNNDALTAELVKMKKVVKKRLAPEDDSDKVPHETLLVIDAAQGRMALDSARQWDKALNVTGLILTKLDGSARGGSVVAVTRDLGIPVKLVGVGEAMTDLRDFEPEAFVDGLLGIGNEGKVLKDRLDTLRKTRDEAVSAKKKQTAVSSKAPPLPSMMDDDDDDDDIMEFEDDDGVVPLTVTGATPSERKRMGKGGGGSSSNKKKKKKKKRN